MKAQHHDAADVHCDPLNAGGQSESEQRPDDRPVWSEAVAVRERYDPSSRPQLPQRVRSNQSGGEHGTHRRAGRPERRDGAEPPDQDDVQNQIQNGQGDTEDHRCSRIPGGAKRDAQHMEDQEAAAEDEHDAEKRQGFVLDGGRCIHQIQQPGGGEVSDRCHDAEAHDERGKGRLIYRTIDLVLFTRSSKARDQHAHAGEHGGDEDDDHQHQLPAHANRGVGGVAHEVANQHVIDDPLQSTDDVREHRRPRDLPDRGPERPFDDGPVVASLRRYRYTVRWRGARRGLVRKLQS